MYCDIEFQKFIAVIALSICDFFKQAHAAVVAMGNEMDFESCKF